MKKQPKKLSARARNIKSEAALKRALVGVRPIGLLGTVFLEPTSQQGDVLLSLVDLHGTPLWEGHLSDFYKKRQPLRGITKAMRKAVQPRRGK